MANTEQQLKFLCLDLSERFIWKDFIWMLLCTQHFFFHSFSFNDVCSGYSVDHRCWCFFSLQFSHSSFTCAIRLCSWEWFAIEIGWWNWIVSLVFFLLLSLKCFIFACAYTERLSLNFWPVFIYNFIYSFDVSNYLAWPNKSARMGQSCFHCEISFTAPWITCCG